MGRHKDGRATITQAAQEAFDEACALGIKPHHGLIHHQHAWLMQQRGAHDQLLTHAVRIAFDELITPHRELEELEELLTARARRAFFQAMQVSHEAEKFTATELLVEKRPVRDKADLPLGLLRRPLYIIPRDDGTASAGFEQANEDFDGGGFAGTVRPQKTKKLPLLDMQIEIFDGDQMAVALFEINRRNHQQSPPGTCRLPGFTGWLPCWHNVQASGG